MAWESPQLNSSNGEAPRIFATPLFVADVALSASDSAGVRTSVVYAATGTGYVYGINARKVDGIEPGEILWSRKLTSKPCRNGRESILSTPVIDLSSNRIYVGSCDDEKFYQAHAFDISSGDPIDGWPVDIDHRSVNIEGINKNGSTRFPDNTRMYQRGALNLSLDGKRLYVPFGHDSASGWLISVDTETANIASAFSTTARTEEHQGGMWSSGGPSIDPQGRIHIATGASVIFAKNKAGIAGVFPESNHNWGQSVIQLNDSLNDGLSLSGTYTPFRLLQDPSCRHRPGEQRHDHS